MSAVTTSRSSFRGGRTWRGVGLIASIASVTAAAAAQTPRTGWEGVRPTGWPGPAAAPAPERVDVAAATPPPGRHRSTASSRSARRKARNRARPAARPAWITLDWDAPQPTDIALDWSRPALAGLPVTRIVSLPASPEARALHASAFESDAAASVAEEARLPVATVIQAMALAPAAPRPLNRAGAPSDVPRSRFAGLRVFVDRVALALGMKRSASVADPPRVANAEGTAAQ